MDIRHLKIKVSRRTLLEQLIFVVTFEGKPDQKDGKAGRNGLGAGLESCLIAGRVAGKIGGKRKVEERNKLQLCNDSFSPSHCGRPSLTPA